MTDAFPPGDDAGPGILLDANGDPVRQGSLMVERQSYERVIDGLKIAAGAYMHLAARGATRADVDNCRGLALRLDQCRRICMQHAGIEDPGRASPSAEVRGEALSYKEARGRLLDGLTQAAGGARQLATCFRGDLLWSRVASDLERLERSIRTPRRRSPMLQQQGTMDGFAGSRPADSALWVPPGDARH